MYGGLLVVVGWMLFVIFSGIVFLIWGWRSGQFKNIEEAKYKMLEDKEPEGYPEREKKKKHKTAHGSAQKGDL